MSANRKDVDRRSYRLGGLECEDCGDRAALFASGWQAERLAGYSDELPALAFHCPACATAESAAAP